MDLEIVLPPEATSSTPSAPTPTPPTPSNRPRRLGAAWLAIAGGGLLLLAAVVVVSSKWQQIPQSVRFAGLLATVIMLAGLAERFRRTVPTTALVTAHLVPGMATTAGAAAGATFGQPWPINVIVGGMVGAACAEVQRLRWSSPRLAVATASAMVLALAGAAAQSGVPVGLLVSLVAVTALLSRRQLEAGTMAAAVGMSPVVAAVTSLKYGGGTMVRIGAAADALVWSAPIAGAFAAAVLGVIAHRRNSLLLAGAAAAALLNNVVAVLAIDFASPWAWTSILPGGLLAVELIEQSPGSSVWRRGAAPVSRYVPAVGLMLMVPCGSLWADWLFGLRSAQPEQLLFVGLCTLANVSVAVRCRVMDPAGSDRAFAALLVGAAALAAGAIGVAEAGTGLMVAALALCALRPTRLSTTARTAGVGFLLTIAPDLADHHRWSVEWLAYGGLILLVGGLLAHVLARHSRWTWDVVAVSVATGLALGGLGSFSSPLMITAGIGSTAIIGTWSNRRAAIAMVIATTSSLSAFGGLGSWPVVAAIGISGAVAAFGLRGVGHRLSAGVHVSAVIAAALLAMEVSPNGVVGMLLVLAIAATGIAFSTPRIVVVDAIGVSATAAALLALGQSAVHMVFFSLAVLVCGVQLLLYGLARNDQLMTAAGGVIGAAAMCSLWFTSGVNAALLESLTRFDVRPADVAALAVGLVLLAAGAGMRRWQLLTSWSAFGPGLAVIAVWTASVQFQRGADWATLVGLVVAVVALGVGGWRKLAGPLVIGTVHLAAATLIASGSQLSSLPAWVWIAASGAVLVTLAGLLEWRTRDDADLVGGLRAMLRQFD